MTEPTLNYVSCPDATGGHRMAWWQWGDPSAGHVVVCVHGLSRQGRDFDVLAQALLARAGGALLTVLSALLSYSQNVAFRQSIRFAGSSRPSMGGKSPL